MLPPFVLSHVPDLSGSASQVPFCTLMSMVDVGSTGPVLRSCPNVPLALMFAVILFFPPSHVEGITILSVDLRLPWESATAFHSPLYNPSYPPDSLLSGSIAQSVQSALSQGLSSSQGFLPTRLIIPTCRA